MIFLYLINLIQAHRILIVGCGIGGSSLAELLNPHFQVVVYDKAKECGGRVDDLEFDTFRVELGATMFIEENKYFKEYVERYNLTKKDRENHDLGIFNKEMLFQTSDSDVYTLAKMLYKYGLSPKTLKDDIKHKLQKFLKIYDYQDRGKFFTNYDQFLQIIGLDKYSLQILSKNQFIINQDYLSELNLNQEFKDEFIKAVIAGIYNQDSDINSVAGIVSLIAAFSSSYRVGEGNREIIRNNMKSVVKYQSRVENITKNEYGRYLVNGQDEYNVVVIASLITYSNISFYGLDNDFEFEEKDGQDAYIYILAAEGVIKSVFVKEDDVLPKSILIIDNDSDLKEIGFICGACFEGKNVYKLQAQAKIDVGKYFYNYKILHGKHWKPAYPRLLPGKTAQIELDKNLYYLNSMEYVASCMEMEIISAKNIANKILHDFYTLSPQHDDL